MNTSIVNYMIHCNTVFIICQANFCFFLQNMRNFDYSSRLLDGHCVRLVQIDLHDLAEAGKLIHVMCIQICDNER